jgi:glycerol-3-phosphate acyltransferase PlsY
VLAPSATLAAVTSFSLVAGVTRYVSAGSLAGAVTLPIAAYCFGSPRPTLAAAMMACAMVILRHRSNVTRLLSGTESRMGARA